MRATRAPARLSIGAVSSEPAKRVPIGPKLPARSWDEAIAELARRQHGVVSRPQLLGLGMGPKAIKLRIERGSLHRLHHGVYKVGYRRISRRGRWMAAVLASGADACLSHRSAARLWRLIPLGGEWPEVSAPPGHRARRRGIVCREAAIAEDEWEVVDGIPVTALFRTIFDLAAVAGRRELERAWHEALAQELRAKVSLPVLLERYPGRGGAHHLRALLESLAPETVTRNDFEEAFLALIDAYGLPRPRMNADLALRGRFFEIDCLWGRERVALELDSRGIHGTPKKFESDRQRDRILVAEGWRTMRVTWRQLRDEPEAIVGDLRLALGQPGPHAHPHGR
ncbi:MAG: type IV toxin-antitoxin system AbiEi family antitoxin domain-containing protein [Solirubrobacterales bacterium]